MFSEELLRKAESSDLEAALEVANCYYRGIDVEEDNDKAFVWFNRILEMDPENVTTLTNLGSCYRGGFGVEQDHCKAVEYYERAIKYDNKSALWYLAEYLFDGVGKTSHEQLSSISAPQTLEMLTHRSSSATFIVLVKLLRLITRKQINGL